MPLIQIKGISGVLDGKKKQELIEKVTDAVVSVEGEGFRPVTTVLLEEVPLGNWAVGGKPVTTECLNKLRADSTAACTS
ncbi:MAG: 4-oxalocrotonate tautomerase [Nitrospinales bacterium]|jgi:4-oxalocrotonate tautomerase